MWKNVVLRSEPEETNSRPIRYWAASVNMYLLLREGVAGLSDQTLPLVIDG